MKYKGISIGDGLKIQQNLCRFMLGISPTLYQKNIPALKGKDILDSYNKIIRFFLLELVNYFNL